MKALKTRLARLERQSPKLCPFVFESMEAAQRAGVIGGVLIVGPVMTYDEWCSVARLQQSRLTSEASYATVH